MPPISRRQQGQILVLFALMLPVVLGMVGLGVEFGFALAVRQRMQSAADLAAINGSYCTLNPTKSHCVAAAGFTGAGGDPATGAALSVAKLNSYQNGVGGATVSVTKPSGNVRVEISGTAPTYFLSAVGFNQMNLSVAAGGGIMSGPSGVALLALNLTACPGITASGNADIDVLTGSVMVNSNCAGSALQTSGNATVTADEINVVGGAQGSVPKNFSQAPNTGSSVMADPLASVSPPSGSGLTNFGAFSCGGNGSATVSPGIYTSFSISGNCEVEMQPGTYVLKGGGLSVSGNGDLSGAEVFIYNAASTFPTSGTSVGNISISGNGDFDLSPPTSGSYKGLLLFSDRDGESQLSISGNGAISGLNGTIYGPAMEANLSGNAGASTMEAQVIADTVSISGNGDVNIQYDDDDVYGASRIALVE